MVNFLTILSSAFLAIIALAQEPTASFNQSVIDQVAGEIDPGQKASWCNGQHRACGVLCNMAASNNTCDPTTLAFTCTCTSNNSAPMFQYYQPTMVSYICNQYLGDCLKKTAMHADQQAACEQEIVCGNSSIDAYTGSSTGGGQNTSSTSSSTMSATSAAGGTAGSTASPAPSKAAAATLQIGTGYATGIFGTVLLGIFGLAL